MSTPENPIARHWDDLVADIVKLGHPQPAVEAQLLEEIKAGNLLLTAAALWEVTGESTVTKTETLSSKS